MNNQVLYRKCATDNRYNPTTIKICILNITGLNNVGRLEIIEKELKYLLLDYQKLYLLKTIIFHIALYRCESFTLHK